MAIIKKPRGPHGAYLAVAVLLSMTAVEAAAVKAPTTGCKDQADAEKVVALEINKDQAGLDKLAQPKIASGDCMVFSRGIAVTADVKKPPLTCVRLTGGLDCYWIAADLVDLNPAQADTNRAGSRGGGRRH